MSNQNYDSDRSSSKAGFTLIDSMLVVMIIGSIILP